MATAPGQVEGGKVPKEKASTFNFLCLYLDFLLLFLKPRWWLLVFSQRQFGTSWPLPPAKLCWITPNLPVARECPSWGHHLHQPGPSFCPHRPCPASANSLLGGPRTHICGETSQCSQSTYSVQGPRAQQDPTLSVIPEHTRSFRREIPDAEQTAPKPPQEEPSK